MDLSAASFSFVSVNRPAIQRNPFARNVKFVDEELNPFSQQSLDNVVFGETDQPAFGDPGLQGPGGFNSLG